jgi:hypothetical protein
VTSWGLGVAHRACYRVTWEASPTRLVLDVRH